MEGKKITLKKTLDRHQVAAFLRLLADELEGKNHSNDNELGWQFHGFNKLKIGLIRQEGGDLALKLKIKNSDPGQDLSVATDFTDIAEQEYRPFKQEMKVTFAELTRCASQGRVPSAELLGRFMAQSKKLIAYAGFGDQYYEEYWQACQELEQEAAKGNLDGFQTMMTTVASIKKSCHSRFK